MPDAPMDDLFEQLWTTSFDDYAAALTAVRARLMAGERRALGDTELLRLLRPFLWWLHAPGFQDVMDEAEGAMQALMDHQGRHPSFIGMPLGHPMVALSTFLTRYIVDGLHDPTGWTELRSSAEEAAASLAGYFADEITAEGHDGAPLRALAARMKSIHEAKRESCRVLRYIGPQRLDELTGYLHDLPERDQALLLGVLDDRAGDAEVIAFYEAYAGAATDDALRDLAAACLSRVRGAPPTA